METCKLNIQAQIISTPLRVSVNCISEVDLAWEEFILLDGSTLLSNNKEVFKVKRNIEWHTQVNIKESK